MAQATSELTTAQLAALLTDPGRRVDAALALGRRQAREHSAAIAAALPGLPARDHAAFVARLEDCWGPPGERDRYLTEAVTPLLALP